MTALRLVSILIATTLFVAAPAASQSVGSASEQSIKAAYLYKLPQYVEWPEGVLGAPQAPLIFAVIGADDLAAELRELTRGRVVLGRRMVVRTVEAQESLSGVHVLFVGQSAMDSLANLTAASGKRAILVITESWDGLAEGSVINLRKLDQRIRLEISLDSADRRRLKLSSRLLAVAAHIQAGTQ